MEGGNRLRTPPPHSSSPPGCPSCVGNRHFGEGGGKVFGCRWRGERSQKGYERFLNQQADNAPRLAPPLAPPSLRRPYCGLSRSPALLAAAIVSAGAGQEGRGQAINRGKGRGYA